MPWSLENRLVVLTPDPVIRGFYEVDEIGLDGVFLENGVEVNPHAELTSTGEIKVSIQFSKKDETTGFELDECLSWLDLPDLAVIRIKELRIGRDFPIKSYEDLLSRALSETLVEFSALDIAYNGEEIEIALFLGEVSIFGKFPLSAFEGILELEEE